MLDIAIVGGGLTGLSLAKTLEQIGFDCRLFEARDRLGGRILSRPCKVSAIPVDLGPAWFWPQTAIVELVAELGLSTFPQRADGTVWVLTDPNQQPQKLENQMLQAGAQRIAGGMARLADALAASLPEDRVVLSSALTGLQDKGTHVEMIFRTPSGEMLQTVRHIALAMPPRLIEEHILFSPALPNTVERALLNRPTWMAQQAKAVVTYGNLADFRASVGSRNAFVHHEQAVLREVFDASSTVEGEAALGGFVALPAAERVRFRVGLETLISSQLVQLFGPALEAGTLHYQDWATERFTRSSLDRREDAPVHSHEGDPHLRAGLWDGTLWFAGTEFAEQHAGHLEGALIDAARVAE
jgi:monoamine oxidase